MLDSQDGLDEAGEACSAFGVSDIRFDLTGE
jgi:hypothetical protein